MRRRPIPKFKPYIRTCIIPSCSKLEIYNGKCWQEHWRRYNGEGWICEIHYARLVTNKNRTKEYKKFHDSKFARKLITFNYKRVNVDEIARTGFCTFCENNILDNSTDRTHIHHFIYDIKNVFKHTIELCTSCHSIITAKVMNLGKRK